MFRFIAMSFAVACSLPSLVACGQSDSYNSSFGSTATHTSASYPTTPPNAMQHHASTLQEGLLRGTASVMQAHYNGQVSHAQARILLAEARAREIQLRVINMQAAQQRRRLVEAERQHQRRLKMENELLGQQLDAARIPLRHAEYRLTPDQLNRYTGEIIWPPAMQHEAFAADTYVLEKLFIELADAGSSETRYVTARIDEACRHLATTLRDLRDNLQLDPTQYQHYLECHRFALGLKYEALAGGMHGSAYSLATQ